jgi:hypothetical protein
MTAQTFAARLKRPPETRHRFQLARRAAILAHGALAMLMKVILHLLAQPVTQSDRQWGPNRVSPA